jgi:hypothetical protein
MDYIHSKRLYLDDSVVGVIAERTDNLEDAISAIKQFTQYAESRQEELSLSCFQA